MSKENQEIDNQTTVETELNEVSTASRKSKKTHLPELEHRIEELAGELAVERDKRLRLSAEFDNFRRRTQAEYRQLVESAAERLLLKILPIVDDFDRLAAQNDSETDSKAIKQGFELIHRKLQSVLESEGVTPIPTLGLQFDALIHDAVAQVIIPDAVPGAVVAEAERGYKLRERILRHAKVVVAQSPELAGDLNG